MRDRGAGLLFARCRRQAAHDVLGSSRLHEKFRAMCGAYFRGLGPAEPLQNRRGQLPGHDCSLHRSALPARTFPLGLSHPTGTKVCTQDVSLEAGWLGAWDKGMQGPPALLYRGNTMGLRNYKAAINAAVFSAIALTAGTTAGKATEISALVSYLPCSPPSPW